MCGKDVGAYSSPTRRDATWHEKRRKKRERKEAIKKREEGPNKKREKKRDGTMLLSYFHTCASK